MSQLRVTLVRSLIGEQWRARRVVLGMGFTKLRQTRVFPDTPSIRGMVRRVNHLLVSEPVQETSGAASSGLSVTEAFPSAVAAPSSAVPIPAIEAVPVTTEAVPPTEAIPTTGAASLVAESDSTTETASLTTATDTVSDAGAATEESE